MHPGGVSVSWKQRGTLLPFHEPGVRLLAALSSAPASSKPGENARLAPPSLKTEGMLLRAPGAMPPAAGRLCRAAPPLAAPPGTVAAGRFRPAAPGRAAPRPPARSTARAEPRSCASPGQGGWRRYCAGHKRALAGLGFARRSADSPSAQSCPLIRVPGKKKTTQKNPPPQTKQTPTHKTPTKKHPKTQQVVYFRCTNRILGTQLVL